MNKDDIKITQIHCGQYKRYDDFYRVWKVETDCKDEGEILNYLFTEVYPRRVPEKQEWWIKQRDAGPDYYFRGYYELKKTDFGYLFTICEPYAD